MLLACVILFQYIRRRKVCFAHDPAEECVEGDIVLIRSCTPITKRKKFAITEIVEKAPRFTAPELKQVTVLEHTS